MIGWNNSNNQLIEACIARTKKNLIIEMLDVSSNIKRNISVITYVRTKLILQPVMIKR